MATLKAILAENLKRILFEKKLSQSQLSEKMDVSFQTINGIANGRVGITGDMISKIAQALGIEESDLVTSQTPPKQVQLSKAQWDTLQKHLTSVPAGPQAVRQDLWTRLSKLPPDQQEIAWEMVQDVVEVSERRVGKRGEEVG
jgi:transcriptional regulator with XRE-family HTH domain